MPTRRLAAVLCSDIQNFQTLLRGREEFALDLVRRHRTILGVAGKKHKGRLLKDFGDTCLYSFDSAVDAAQCAVDIHRLLSDYNSGKPPGDLLHARVGIHLGDVVVEGQNVYGSSVHVAQSLCTAARPGGICLSREVHDHIKGSVAHAFSDAGTHRVEGVESPIEIYQDAAAPAPAPAAPAADAPLTLTPAESPPPSENLDGVRPPDPIADFARNLPQQKRHLSKEKLPAEPPPQTERITRAVLSVDHRFLLFEDIGGMRVIERQLFTLARAGIREVWLSTHPLKEKAVKALRWPKDLAVRWAQWAEDEYSADKSDEDEQCEPPYASVSGDHFIRLEALRELFTTFHKLPTSYQDGNHYGVVQIALKPSLHHVGFESEAMPRGSFFRLSKVTDKRLAVRWLLKEARKAQDSFMARNFDRRVSLAVTQRLLNTRITPNDMTIFSAAVGAAGALILAGGGYAFTLAGALIIWLHTLLDGCDGELARLRFQESRRGGEIDFWGDNIVHFLLFGCLGIGQFRAGGGALCLLLGAIAAICSLASALIVYRHSVERAERRNDDSPLFQGIDDIAGGGADPQGRGLTRWLARIEHLLTQRDFIYLFVVLALGNKTIPFLWAAGLGSPLFLAVLILLRFSSKKNKM
ncbi:MAG: CDP-alcohol phosphatidyltransferase family protein [Elusimicrobiota bacterium]